MLYFVSVSIHMITDFKMSYEFNIEHFSSPYMQGYI